MNFHTQRIAAFVAAFIAALQAIVLLIMTAHLGYAHAQTTPCASWMSWPVENPVVVQKFDSPAQPWLPGHRGVDVRALPGEPLYAPERGRISFAGKVAGKDVVVISHAYGLRSTFEPATTTLPVGHKVTRGEEFATRSSGISDHCRENCLQWGVKRGKNQYVNPERLTVMTRITLLRPQE